MKILSEHLSDYCIKKFWLNGIAVIENFFSEKDLATYLEIGAKKKDHDDSAKNYVEMYYQCVKNEDFNEILFSKKIIKIISELLNSTPTYFGHLSSWHRMPKFIAKERADIPLSDAVEISRLCPPYDAKAHIDAKGKSTNLFGVRHGIEEKYGVIRCAWFPQSFREKSLSMRAYPGTHLDGLATPETEPVYLDVNDRDLIIFSLKTIHSALSLLPASTDRQTPIWRLTPQEEVEMLRWQPDLFKPAPNTRNSLFWDFCDGSREAELFIRNRAVLNTAEPIHCEMYRYDLLESAYLRSVQHAGLLKLRHDLRYVYLLRRFANITDRSRSLSALQELVNSESIIPVEEDLAMTGSMLERSGSQVWQ